MDQNTRFVNVAVDGAGRARQAWTVVQRQPGWVTRIAFATFMLVIAIPMIILFSIAILAGLIVFFVLGLAARVLGVFRGAGPRRDGRENVVVRRR